MDKRWLKGEAKNSSPGIVLVLIILNKYYSFRLTGTAYFMISVTETAEIWFAQIYSLEV